MSHRSYQFDIVKACLYQNTLVCLPTGLGKTFIAAVIMYNFYRWYPQGKIVFMAPTKPLVAQQIEACFKIMGIPQEDTKEMTGSVAVSERTKAWASRRVFFLTPQVMSNDLSRGLFPAKEVKLLIVDEAHKAQGEYAYCLVSRELNRAKAMTRIVALSATPGTDIPNVKAMLQNLFISHIELRHEESPDIVPYTHTRVVDKIVVPMDRNILDIKEKLLGVMEIYTKRLSAATAIRKGHNPSAYTKFGFISFRAEWRQNPPANLASHVKGQVEGDFAAAIKLYHGMELVTTQGLRSFYNFFTKETDQDNSSKRIRGELSRIPMWRDILAIVTEKFSGDAYNTVLNQVGPILSQVGAKGMAVQKTATSHPKMDRLLDVVQEHFVKYAKDGMETRVIIFSQFRDCVTELVACLASLKPTVRPMPFIGQAGSAGKKGLTQKEQIEVVRRFKEGGYNTLVATCVGEEGLDIGEVDLIVLYDVARSPIRLVQRMGRTGRKREGRIVVLVTEGQEERVYNQSLVSKKNINKAILEKERLEHVLYNQAPRMVPLGVEPVCHKMKMIVGEWKGKYDGLKNAGQRIGIQGYTKKMAKDDVFKQNCGFLTEAEEERWRRDVRWEGEVKMVRRGMELCAGKGGGSDSPTKQRNFFNLGEYSLWQTGDQFRRCVSSSSVSSTYRRLVEMMGDKGALQERIEATQEARRVLERGRGATMGGNNIMKYFKPSQNKSMTQVTPFKKSLINTSGKHETIILDAIREDEVVEHIEDDISISVTSSPLNLEVDITPSPTMDVPISPEESLLAELFDDEDGDSGVSSLPPSPSSPPSFQTLLDFPPSLEEGKTFDVLAAIERARIRIYEKKNRFDIKGEGTIDVVGKLFGEALVRDDLIVMPVEKNESLEDMFAEDDSLFGDINYEEMENKHHPPADKGKDIISDLNSDQAANFELESPIVSPAMLDPPMEDANSQFDLGSPILLEEDDQFPSDSVPHATQQAPKLALMSRLKPITNSSTSTPLPGHLTAPSGPDLTPVHPVIRALNLQASPLLSRPPPAATIQARVKTSLVAPPASSKNKLSDDMFVEEESDEEIFNNLIIPVGADNSKSVFSATQLVSMVNTSGVGGLPGSNDIEPEGKLPLSRSGAGNHPAGSRRKLSNLFDEFSEDMESLVDDEADFKSQMKMAIKESLKTSPIEIQKMDEASTAVEAVFDLSDIEFSQESIYKKHAVVELDSSRKVLNIQYLSREASFSEDMFADDEDFSAPDESNVFIPTPRHNCQSRSSDESLNLLQENLPSSSRLPPPPKPTQPITIHPQIPISALHSETTTDCPVCGRAVASDINQHLDDCLSAQVIDELTQNGGEANAPSCVGAIQGCEERNKMELDISNSSPESPIVRQESRREMARNSQAVGGSQAVRGRWRGRVMASQSRLDQSVFNGNNSDNSPVVRMGKEWKGKVMASQCQLRVEKTVLKGEESDDSPVSRRGCGLRGRVIASQSITTGDESDDSPVGRGRRGRARVLASQSGAEFDDSSVVRAGVETSNSSDCLTVIKEKKKYKKTGAARGFIELEADVSGDSGSSDNENDATDDRYDESFVDEATQATDMAVYLRSVRSPEFRRPQQRVLPPITEDIFSQAVGQDSQDCYEEDSFCVGSQQVEWDTGIDTLEMLERRAEGGVGDVSIKRKRSESLENGISKRRKRIIAPASDEETIIQIPDESSERIVDNDMDGINFEDFDNSCFPESENLLAREDDRMLLQPDLSTSIMEAEKCSIIISSTEVNKVPEVISSLKHLHHLNVSIRSCEVASFILGQEMAVMRVSEVEFGTGTMKDKLLQRVKESKEEYSKTTLIVEWEKVKPGDRPKSGTRTKNMDLIVGQLAMAGVMVMYSTGQMETATLLAGLIKQENLRGMGLPRPMKLTVWQEEMVKWILQVPGTGLATAIQVAIHFSTLRELVTANLSQVMDRGRLCRMKADMMVNFFSRTFQSDLTDMAPL